jgi:hypothetical protein
VDDEGYNEILSKIDPWYSLSCIQKVKLFVEEKFFQNHSMFFILLLCHCFLLFDFCSFYNV